jgi:hypothetical protein
VTRNQNLLVIAGLGALGAMALAKVLERYPSAERALHEKAIATILGFSSTRSSSTRPTPASSGNVSSFRPGLAVWG